MFWFPIDWTPFFRTWQLFGKYPAILNRWGGWRTSDLRFADAQEMLAVILKEKKLTAKAVYGIFGESNRWWYELTENGKPLKHSWHCVNSLKNQRCSNIALADFIAPKTMELQIIWAVFV
jgi:5-methyltetrahydrofolate--homocysteine methyltransferase